MIQVYTLPARYIYLLTSCISQKTFLYQILIFFTFQSFLTFLTNYTLLHISKVVVTNLKEHTLTSCHTIFFFFFLLSCHVSSSCLIHSSGSFHSKFGSLLVCSGQSQSRVIIDGERDATQLFYSYLCNYCLGLILTILSSSLGCCLVVVNLKTRTRITTGT